MDGIIMRALAVPLLGLLLLASACGGESTGQEPRIASRLPAKSVQAGPQVPDFALSTGHGSTFSLSSHKGQVVILYFSFPVDPPAGWRLPPWDEFTRNFRTGE